MNGNDEPSGKGGYDIIAAGPGHLRCIRTRDWKYTHYFTPGASDDEFELYDLANDPLEMINLGNDPGYSTQRKELHNRLFERERGLREDANS